MNPFSAGGQRNRYAKLTVSPDVAEGNSDPGTKLRTLYQDISDASRVMTQAKSLFEI